MKYNPTLHKLSNGVTVILDPMDIETVAAKVYFTTGSRDELPNEYGITHFCEHMLCKGTKKLPNKMAIDDYMDYYNNERYQWNLKKLSPSEFYKYSITGELPNNY